jgi:hypothetical protein
MSQTLLLPAFFALFGVGAALFFLGFGAARSTAFDGEVGHQDRGDEHGDDEVFADDHDEYVEYTVSWDDAAPMTAMPADAEPVTEPTASRAPQVLHAPADVWHDQPVESWRHVSEDEDPDYEPRRTIFDLLQAEDPPVPSPPEAEPIGFAHNGFHVEPPGRHARHLGGESDRVSRHGLREDDHEARPFWFESSGRHSRDDSDESWRHGRHSTPWRD